MPGQVTISPYDWKGPYAEMRSSQGWDHDAGLCAVVRADWMPPGERLILRTSEIVGFGGGFLYDDHFPPCEPETRGKGYEHIAFQWDTDRAPEALSARCEAPGRGVFTLDLVAREDGLDIALSIRSDTPALSGVPDWHFCVVAHDAPSIGDPDVTRTFLFDGERLRSLAELQGGTVVHMHHVAGANRFLPASHQTFPRGPVEAHAPMVLVEGADGNHTVALAFERSYAIFSNPTNQCFHADPYFGQVAPGKTYDVRGRLGLVNGDAQQAFEACRRHINP